MGIEDLAPGQSINAVGQIGRTWVYYLDKCKQRRRAYVVPSNPQTPRQQCKRAFFRMGMDYWHSQGQAFRDEYATRVDEQDLKLHPINLFLAEWLKGEIVNESVKSIQKGKATCVNGVNNITITEVETEKSVVIINSYANAVETGATVYSAAVYGGQLSSSTNLQIEVALLNVPNVPVFWQVIEFY